MINAFFAVGAGAACGAWLRWGFAFLLNQGLMPIGTLLANLLGAYLMGLALAVFMYIPSISNEMKLMITTGFLGGLTTFSTFSAESFGLLQRQEYAWVIVHILSHVVGSLLMIALGYYTVHLLKS